MVGRRTAIAVYVITLIVGGVIAYRTEVQGRQIRDNQIKIVQTQYDQCAIRNEAAGRQNALLDSAVASERRREKPDLVRIDGLIRFKSAIVSCGVRP